MDPNSAGGWGLLLGQGGAVLVWAATLAFLAGGLLTLRPDKAPSWLPRGLFTVGAACLFGVFAVLLVLFLTGQYQFQYVYGHSQSDYELEYKIAGVWAGQEGSILLWSCLTAVFGLASLKRMSRIGPWYGGAYGLLMALMAGISAYESPFRLLADPSGHLMSPEDGKGMAPALLNYWMVIHPPTIFTGFALTAVAFCAAVAALAHGKLDEWVPLVRPWSLACLGVLGLGLCMGGFWAYETLGWGGFWMWDPVENASFVPWCATAAFTHGVIVQQSRRKWRLANAILGAAPFILFCYGTFLTRSGFLGDTSVHSFAKMDRQALGILIGLMGASLGGFLAALIPAWLRMRREGDKAPEIREPLAGRTRLYALGIWILFAFGLLTAFGMSVPLIQSLGGQKPKVVEEATYNQILGWFFIPGMIFLALAPFTRWNRSALKELGSRIMNPLALAVMFTGFLLIWARWGWMGRAMDPAAVSVLSGFTVPKAPFVGLLAFLCFFVLFATLFRLAEMLKTRSASASGLLTHIGFAMGIMGLLMSRGLEQKAMVTVHPSRPVEGLGWTFAYKGPTKGFEDRSNAVALDVTGPGGSFTALPGLYFKPSADGPQAVIWPYIKRRFLYDLYLTLHPMAWEASDTTGLAKGRQARFENMVVTYKGMRSTGTLGTSSARFFAPADVTILGKPQTVEPQLLLGQSRVSEPARLADGRTLTLLQVDVKTGAIAAALSSSPKQPISLVQGASIARDGLRITLETLATQQGHAPDQAVLAARIKIEPIEKTMSVEPWMSMREQGKVRLTSEYDLVLERIDAATKAAFYRFDYVRPAYPLEVFYKPLTWMVWSGVGIMTLGALWSAWGRRPPRRGKAAAPEPGQEPAEPEGPEEGSSEPGSKE